MTTSHKIYFTSDAFRFAAHRTPALSVLLGRGSAGLARSAPRANCATSERVRAVAEKEMNAYWTKNYQLGRPWSPHLTVYKAELPMLTSLAHRATGIAMTMGKRNCAYDKQYLELSASELCLHFSV